LPELYNISACRGDTSRIWTFPLGNCPLPGGTHDPVWQNCGIYDEPLNTANVIHSLEHGAAWITYQPDLPTEQIEAIQEKFRGQTYIIISPYPEQLSPIVLTAWGVQLGS
jgi:hypothetical protein